MSSTSTTSTTLEPLSPFSDGSQAHSDAVTSDETPDLGAFHTVLRALSNLQPIPRIRRPPPPATPSTLGDPDDDDDPFSLSAPGAGTPQQQTARPSQSSFTLPYDYLTDTHPALASPYRPTAARSAIQLIDLTSDSESDSELEQDEGVFSLDSDSPTPDGFKDDDLPTLGQFDSALSYLAAERQKWQQRSSSDKAKEKRKSRRRKAAPKALRSLRNGNGNSSDDEASSCSNDLTSANDEPKPPTSNLSRREKRRLKLLAQGVDPPSAAAATSPPAKGKKGKGLHHSKSTPQLRLHSFKQNKKLKVDPLDVDIVDEANRHPSPKVEKLRSLARKLKRVFPEDGAFLTGLLDRPLITGGDEERNGKGGLWLPSPTKETIIVDDSDDDNADDEFIDVRGPSPRPIPASPPIGRGASWTKEKKHQKGKGSFSKDKEKKKEEEPREKIVHVFIDHSNILIGLLSYLKRHPRKFPPLPPPPASAVALAAAKTPTKQGHKRAQSSSSSIAHPQVHHFHSTPNYHQFDSLNYSASTAATSTATFFSPDAQTSLSTSLTTPGSQSASALNSSFQYPHPMNLYYPHLNPHSHSRPLKPTNHLSHPALALILERGRPVSRRVLVTSSPLYQPMEGAEKLGYEVRVFMRVPDLGDGMDRIGKFNGANGADGALGKHGRSISLGNPGSNATTAAGAEVNGEFPNSLKAPKWGKNANGGSPPSSGGGSSPTKPHPGNAKIMKKVPSKRQLRKKGHKAGEGSTSTTAESSDAVGGGANGVVGSIPSTPPNASGFPGSGPGAPPHTMPLPTPQRIKYREQGVDELLQLKLHQAIASADALPYPLPPGSTIVLATGDGNRGQFNEDGFLGSVRTALRRGWEVELYAWEEGLSRRWSKEFGVGVLNGSGSGKGGGGGHGGEWEGKFRVIGMEQFGEELVERSWW